MARAGWARTEWRQAGSAQLGPPRTAPRMDGAGRVRRRGSPVDVDGLRLADTVGPGHGLRGRGDGAVRVRRWEGEPARGRQAPVAGTPSSGKYGGTPSSQPFPRPSSSRGHLPLIRSNPVEDRSRSCWNSTRTSLSFIAALCACTPTPTPTCRSFCGFQSLSNMMTVSAVARLMPSPPARVDSRKAKSGESGRLKCSMAACREAAGVEPSSRWCGKPRSRM